MAHDTGERQIVRDDVSDPVVVTPAPTRPRRPFRPVRSSAKVLILAAVIWFFVLPLIPGFRKAAHELREVDPLLLVLGLALEIAALFAYSMLTRSALGASGRLVSPGRLFRIQLSTKAVGSVVPGGAASPALAYRLLTLSGVPGPDAGFALGAAGLGSAVVLNLIFWVALIISIPLYGINKAYVSAAIAGVLIMSLAAAVVFGLMEGQERAERVLRWIARHLRQDEDRAGDAVRHVGNRMGEMIKDRAMVRRIAGWATANWLLDAASLWVFLRAYGESLGVVGLVVCFGLANIVAVIPITPGGLGIVESVYVPMLVWFGLTRGTATLGVASYRLAQLFFPILLGGVLYLSLRIGPWKIRRNAELKRMRDMAVDPAVETESSLEFHERFVRRPPPRSDDSIELARLHPELWDPPFDGRDDLGDDDA